jgi:2-keto-4-pentenoate hydratase/2-oxohepta-3-ene-1,7-dioic acid hydratase in catechol pathway
VSKRQEEFGVKLARVLIDGSAVLARLDGDLLVPVHRERNGDGGPPRWSSEEAARLPATGAAIPAAEAEFLPAVAAPDKIIAVGLNYHDHAQESSLDLPSAPLLFTKTNNTLLAHGATIRCPSDLTTETDYEAELAVIIGAPASRVSPEDALAHIFAYSVANDVSARDAQFSDGQWTRGKSFDTYCPIGPYLTLADSVPDVMNLRISTRLNGEVMQDDNTRSMIFDVAYLVSYISRFMTLVPGDVILTGTPSGVGFARRPAVYLRDSDVVEVEIEGLGVLRNPVSTAPVLAAAGPAGGVASP